MGDLEEVLEAARELFEAALSSAGDEIEGASEAEIVGMYHCAINIHTALEALGAGASGRARQAGELVGTFDRQTHPRILGALERRTEEMARRLQGGGAAEEEYGRLKSLMSTAEFVRQYGALHG